VGDRLRQFGYNVIEVQFGSESPNPKYADKRTFIWMQAAAALRAGVAIDADPTLESDLTGPEYTHDRLDRLKLEAKEHMKARGLASPDDGDAFAMLFAEDIPPKNSALSSYMEPTQTKLDYNPYRKP
jgi:hypothetical protein